MLVSRLAGEQGGLLTGVTKLSNQLNKVRTMPKTFDIAVVLTVYFGIIMLNKPELKLAQELLEHINGEAPTSDTLSRLTKEARQRLREQLPWLTELVSPGKDQTKNHYFLYLHRNATIYGKTHEIYPPVRGEA